MRGAAFVFGQKDRGEDLTDDDPLKTSNLYGKSLFSDQVISLALCQKLFTLYASAFSRRICVQASSVWGGGGSLLLVAPLSLFCLSFSLEYILSKCYLVCASYCFEEVYP